MSYIFYKKNKKKQKKQNLRVCLYKLLKSL